MLSFWVFLVFNKSSYLYWKLQIPDVCMLSIFPSPTKRFLLSELANACQKKKIILRNAIFETSFLKIAECMLKLPFIYVLDSDDGTGNARRFRGVPTLPTFHWSYWCSLKDQKGVGKMASSKAKEVHTSIKKNIILLTLLFESLELVEMVLLSRMDGMCLLVEQANS